MNNKDIQQILDDFIKSQNVMESSKNLYVRTLMQYFKWINKMNINFYKTSLNVIVEYKQSLFNSGKSNSTVASYLSSLKKFYKYTEAMDIYPNVAKSIQTPKMENKTFKKALTQTQVEQLLEYFEAQSKKQSKRNRAIINLMLRTGLRPIEVSNLNIEDITLYKGKRILKVQIKGSCIKDEISLLTDEAYKYILEYLRGRDKGPLFTSISNNESKGERLGTESISSIVKEGLRRIGLNGKEYTAYSLRHTAACITMDGGGKLTDVQILLHHKTVNTTYIKSIMGKSGYYNPGELIIDKLI